MSGSIGDRLLEMFDVMLNHFGPQHWWPGETKFEVMVGAILTQNTNWNNVEKAIRNLKTKNLLSIEALHLISKSSLADNIRPAGYYNIKAGRLKNLINFIIEKFDGDIACFLGQKTDELRKGLMSINGVGHETADSILLYAADRPVFVIDTYTHRILNRHGLVDDHAAYFDLQELFKDSLPEDTVLFNEFHALIVRTGKEYCRRKPRCNICPLEKW
ncbi:endonuclease III domain-containing protein [Deltaproteobacteria bacterium]|nr:endonuclease III domain-containing protein [Deltaproteobacteria bacterium]